MAAKKFRVVAAQSFTRRKGKEYLVDLHKHEELVPRCTCKSEGPGGRWLVADVDGSLYCFDPPTQFQKDVWLGASEYEKKSDHEERIKALRWACFGCGTVQLP